MKIVIFGLTVSSSRGDEHTMVWRSLIDALHSRGHKVVFFERDVPYYAGPHRDLEKLPGGELVLYSDWERVRPRAERELADADVGVVTSYCPDGRVASELVLSSRTGVKVFYDLDTPTTLQQLRVGEMPAYLPTRGLGDFDLVLSCTGGKALEQLRTTLSARRVAALHSHVSPETHRPVAPLTEFRADLSYLGTYAADRQTTLETLLIAPAHRLPHRRFLIGGAQYPADFPWMPNITLIRHLPASQHAAFFSSSRLTLNVTRKVMADFGFCPSGRLFEAAACGTPILSDWWPGLEKFFEPGKEILVARNTEEAIQAIQLSDDELGRIARAARERTLEQHTSMARAREFEAAIEGIGLRDDSADSAATRHRDEGRQQRRSR